MVEPQLSAPNMAMLMETTSPRVEIPGGAVPRGPLNQMRVIDFEPDEGLTFLGPVRRDEGPTRASEP